MTGLSRRNVVLGAAWSVPVIAAAIATPLAAASQPPAEPPVITCGGTPYDNGTYTVQGCTLIISFKRVPDIYEVNAKGSGWAKSYGTNYGTAPKPGSLTWTIVLPAPPTWVQVHTFNAHLGENC